jgi:ketosteroid isomerase-like protein
MTPQDNAQIAKQAYDNFKRGDIPSLLNQLTDDVQWELPDVQGVSHAGKRQGRAAVADFFSQLAAMQEVLSFEPREFVSQGDKVVVLGTYTYRVKQTNKQFTSDWAHVFTIVNGKITGFQEYTDTAAVAGAFQGRAASAA